MLLFATIKKRDVRIDLGDGIKMKKFLLIASK